MGRAGQIAKKTLTITYIVMLHVIAVFYIGEKTIEYYFPVDRDELTGLNPSEPVGMPTPLPQPTLFESTPIPTPTPAPTILSPIEGPPDRLVIPVAGIKRSQLIDTYADARSDERTHDAIDIPAPVGTPVLAVADGEIVRFHDSELGGITIYQISADRKFVYYYAHLQGRAAGLSEKQSVSRGTVIGYVGDTGNAGQGNFHLHFSIGMIQDPDRYFDSVNINPYPLLINGIEVPQ
jgi:peptidoglycan LD-endopeptidase LytH